jgi:rhodanese-related sulfurtransferase
MSAEKSGHTPRRRGVMDRVAAARASVEGLSVEQLRQELATGDPILLDIRDVRERWKQGAIPGARSTPRGMLEFWADSESPYYRKFMDPAKRTIVYCAGGMRSALAAETLIELGFENVAHLEVGFDGWKEAGAETEEIPVPDDLGK